MASISSNLYLTRRPKIVGLRIPDFSLLFKVSIEQFQRIARSFLEKSFGTIGFVAIEFFMGFFASVVPV